jgi:hypothetical protein
MPACPREDAPGEAPAESSSRDRFPGAQASRNDALSRCTNPVAPRCQAAQVLNAAYQNFYTAVEVNAAPSLSLRVLVRARLVAPARRPVRSATASTPWRWTHENTREVERLNSHQRHGAFGRPDSAITEPIHATIPDPLCDLIPESRPVSTSRILSHCALREHPRELPGWREVRLSLANATSNRRPQPRDRVTVC